MLSQIRPRSKCDLITWIVAYHLMVNQGIVAHFVIKRPSFCFHHGVNCVSEVDNDCFGRWT